MARETIRDVETLTPNCGVQERESYGRLSWRWQCYRCDRASAWGISRVQARTEAKRHLPCAPTLPRPGSV